MKLLVCDVEGTIFDAKYRIDGTDYASTMWQPIAQALGDDAIAEEYHTHQKWENLEYNNYLEWVEDSIKIHRKFGLEEKVFKSLISDAKYKTGVREFFKKLDRTEYIPVLVSGGFQNLIDRAQKELNIKYGYGACNYIFGKSGKLFGYNLQQSDFKDKMNFISWIFDLYGLDKKKDWIFIGDGKNDKYIAEQAPISFGIDPHPELEKVVNYSIHSFDEIMPILEEIDKEKAKPITNYFENKQPITRLEKLEKDNADLRKYAIRLKNRLDELVQSKNNINYNTIAVFDSDYSKKPPIPLKDILDDCKVALIGFSETDHSYHYFLKYHKNLKLLGGFHKSVNPILLRNANFVFKNISVTSHSVGYRLEKEYLKNPHCEIKDHRGNEIMERAMANVLCRYYHIEETKTS